MGKIILVLAMCLVVGTPTIVLSDTSILEESQLWFDDLVGEIKKEVESVKAKADVYYLQVGRNITNYKRETIASLEKEVDDVMGKILHAYPKNDIKKCSPIARDLRKNITKVDEAIEENAEKQKSVSNAFISNVNSQFTILNSLIEDAKTDRQRCTSTALQNTPSKIGPSECIRSVGLDLLTKKTKSSFMLNFKKLEYHWRIVKLRLIKDMSAKIRVITNQIHSLFDKVKPCIV